MKYPLTCFCNDSKVNNDVESGFQRVKKMYQLDNYGLLGPEMHFLIQSTSTTLVISGLMGAFSNMRKVKDNYFRQNTASTFESQHLARRKLTDTMTLSGFRGAAKYALKYGSFSSIYLLSTMTIATYNNKITVWEHIGTGALLGAIVRINFGIKGMAAAASVGGFLGSLSGGILVLYMWLNNITLADLRTWRYENYYDARKRRAAGKII